MALHRLVFPLLVLSVVQCFASIQVPVFLWGDLSKASEEVDPLRLTTGQELEEIFHRELKNEPFIVAFKEFSLSVSDFAHGSKSYPYLSSVEKSVYVPAADDPATVLDNLVNAGAINDINENDLSENLIQKGGSYLVIDLNEARDGESREELLRRHNKIMQDTFNKLKSQHENVVAIYTARFPSHLIPVSHERVRRQAKPAPLRVQTRDAQSIKLPSLLVQYRDVLMNSLNLTGDYTSGSTDIEGVQQKSTLTYGSYSITFYFTAHRGYWNLDTIEITNGTETNVLYAKSSPIYALMNNSYRCGLEVEFTTHNNNETSKATVIFKDLWLQPFFNTTTLPEDLTYGEAFNCIGYFSVPIWAGLFVVFILLGITFLGIMMMMDIRTMDRFDDPKGKTITINTSE